MRARRGAGPALAALVMALPVSGAEAQAPVMAGGLDGDPPPVRVSVRSVTAPAAPGEPIVVTLGFDVPRGWYVYAPDPGTTGLPTRVTWEGDVRVVAEGWPAPRSRTVGADTVRTYAGSLGVPFTLLPPDGDPDRDGATATATVRWGACLGDRLCIPADTTLRVRLPGSPRR